MNLSDEKVHPFVLFAALTKVYQHEWMSWEPVVLRQTLEKDFRTSVAKVNLSKALATAMLATKDSFWESWEVFSFLTQALNGIPPVADQLQEHTVGEMMVAVDIANAIRGSLSAVVPHPVFTEQVARFVAAQSLHDGVWYLPTPLDFATSFAEGKSYRCRDCGNVSEIMFDDGLCDSCVDRFDTDMDLKNWHPDPELLAKGRGKNLEFFYKNPFEKVKARYEEALRNPGIKLQENQTDTCVSRLLMARAYMLAVRSRMETGLQELG